MSDIADLNARRWAKVDDPAKHDPVDALRAALRAIDEGLAAEHVIVVVGRVTEDGASGTRFFQAGSYTYHAQLGLIEEAKLMMREAS